MTAHCDIATGKIYGCKRGSWQWHHEKGHIVFNQIEKLSMLKVYQNLALTLLLFVLIIGILNKLAFLFAVPIWFFYIGVDVYEELWCNRYANFKLNKKRRRKTKDLNMYDYILKCASRKWQ